MEDSKIISLFRKLSSRELTKFSEYVHSPFFNKHEPTRKLCDYLLRLAPRFEHKRKLKKENIFRHLYPNRSFNNATFHRNVSQLLGLLHDFLIDLNWKEQKVRRHLALMFELRKRREEKHYGLVRERYEDAKENNLQSQNEACFHDYLYHQELNKHFVDSGGRHYNEHLQLQNNLLDQFFAVEKLYIACDMASRNMIIKANYQATMLPQLQAFIDESEFKEVPAIKVYRAILRMQTAEPPENETHYKELKQLLGEHVGEFTDEELTNAYSYALNFSAIQINRGKKEYYREMLDNYIFLVERRLVFVDGYLPPAHYKNIVTVGLRVGEYEWIEKFIHSYKETLPPDIRENAYSFNLASFYYETQRYGLALQALHNVDFVDDSIHLGAKIIQLKSYYALDESEAMLSLIEAFNGFLRRNKTMGEYRKLANFNLLKLTKKLYKLKEAKLMLESKKYQEKQKKFVTELTKTTPISNKVWLESCLKKNMKTKT